MHPLRYSLEETCIILIIIPVKQHSKFSNYSSIIHSHNSTLMIMTLTIRKGLSVDVNLSSTVASSNLVVHHLVLKSFKSDGVNGNVNPPNLLNL